MLLLKKIQVNSKQSAPFPHEAAEIRDVSEMIGIYLTFYKWQLTFLHSKEDILSYIVLICASHRTELMKSRDESMIRNDLCTASM